MIEKALRYLVGLKANKTYEIEGSTYSDNALVRIAPHVDRPKCVSVTGLDSIVKLVRNELKKVDADMLPVYIRVDDERHVSVFTSLDKMMRRNDLYGASADAPGFRDGLREYDKAIIELRSRFIPNEGTAYLLDLLSRITKESGVTTEDNGVTQSVEARTGISLKQKESVRPRVALRPFRTFSEVEQPESEFLVRLDKEGNVGIYEADGGMWKLEAKRNIGMYFERELKDLIADEKVVVMI